MACSSYAVRFLFSVDWPAGLPANPFSASWLLPHWFFLFLAVEDSLVLSPAEKEGPCQFLIPSEVRGKHGSPAPQIIQQALAAVLLRLVKTFGQWLGRCFIPRDVQEDGHSWLGRTAGTGYWCTIWFVHLLG